MRALATVRTVHDVRPIEGADLIELALVDGWQCVVKKGEFKPGDAGLYFEIDSFLPAEDPRFAFLERDFRTNSYGMRGARLRTIKLRGQISQGLLLPLAEFPEAANDDIAEAIGVTKWEPPMPACLSGVARGNFPGFLRKTDQERIQNCPAFLEDTALYEVTVKLDGSSMTAYYHEGHFGVCSRNLELEETEGNTFWKVARLYGMRDRLQMVSEVMLKQGVAIQGELIGEGIQGNPENIQGHDFYLFDVWLIGEGRFATQTERLAIQRQLGVNHVPVLTLGDRLPGSVAGCLAMAEGKSLNLKVQREGVVFKRLDGKRSFKAISNKYLLKNKDA